MNKEFDLFSLVLSGVTNFRDELQGFKRKSDIYCGTYKELFSTQEVVENTNFWKEAISPEEKIFRLYFLVVSNITNNRKQPLAHKKYSHQHYAIVEITFCGT